MKDDQRKGEGLRSDDGGDDGLSFLLFGSSHPMTPLRGRDQRERIEGNEGGDEMPSR